MHRRWLIPLNTFSFPSDYLVPFPAFPGVLGTAEDKKNGAGLFSHQLASLHAMVRAENRNKAFGALRGGILGDAPGVSKKLSVNFGNETGTFILRQRGVC